MSEANSTVDRPKSAAGKANARARSIGEWRQAFETEAELGRLFFDLYRLLGKTFTSNTKEIGLTRAQWRVLFTLDRTKGGLTQTALADLTEMEKAPLGKMLDRLEEGGWIIRKNNPKDRRARLVYATAKIDKYADRLAQAAKATFAQMLQGVRQSEVKVLVARLEKLKRNLGGADD